MSLAKQGMKAVKWSAIATVARLFLQFGAQVVLARILGPENYGIFGMGMIVLALTTVFSNFGFGWSLMHRKVVTEEDIRFAFTWQCLVGAVATLVLFFLAPSLAMFFHEPRVEPVIRWLALTCIITAVSSASGNLMYRDLKFKASGLIQLGGYVAGYLLVGVPLAVLGYGVNALVAAWLVQTAIITIGRFVWHPHSIKPLFHYSGGMKALGTSGTVFITNIINWCLSNIDRFLLGKLATAHAVGVYSAGSNLATMPSTLLMQTLQPALTAAASKMQDEPQRMRNLYMQIFAAVWVLTLPVFAFLSISAFDLVKLLYGNKWVETGWVLSLMFLSVPAAVCLGLTTPVLWSFGRKHHESLLQLPILGAAAGGFYLSIPYGINAFAFVAVLMVLARTIFVCGSVFQLLKVGIVEIAGYLLRGLLLSTVTAVVAYGAIHSVSSFGSPLLDLLTSAVASFCVVGCLVYAKPDLVGAYSVSMIARFSAKVGARLQARLGGVHRTA